MTLLLLTVKSRQVKTFESLQWGKCLSKYLNVCIQNIYENKFTLVMPDCNKRAGKHETDFSSLLSSAFHSILI